MKIAVCVKQVPDATVHKKIDPQTKRLDRSGEAALNPTDLNAVEEALRDEGGAEAGRWCSSRSALRRRSSRSGRRWRWARIARC